ncbi:hypothetical protein AFA_05590 [Alcaligenes faecalis]|uniref:Uncharacterized protein n=1 Tax=Alcaligenes faecalis TaxID=511 RepID=A0AB33CT43_ALCFA|nr:hypothetical protein AFA_05590 [Alcaligenes faecalis]AYR21910.1 hypothetical protein D6I95_17145 [Alcaligenes faecalis]
MRFPKPISENHIKRPTACVRDIILFYRPLGKAWRYLAELRTPGSPCCRLCSGKPFASNANKKT